MENMTGEQAKKIVIEGYVNILKRWPDKSGMDSYSKLLMSGELIQEQFHYILANSDEYKDRFGSSISAIDDYVVDKNDHNTSHAEISNDELQKIVDKSALPKVGDDVNKDDINKDDVNKDDINKDDVNKDDINKDDVNKNDINKDDVNKNDINKDEKSVKPSYNSKIVKDKRNK